MVFNGDEYRVRLSTVACENLEIKFAVWAIPASADKHRRFRDGVQVYFGSSADDAWNSVVKHCPLADRVRFGK